MSKLNIIFYCVIVIVSFVVLSAFAYPKYEFIHDGHTFYRCNRVTGNVEKKGTQFADNWRNF